jgi:hypothetical protein
MPGVKRPSTVIVSVPPWPWAEAVTRVTEGHVPDEVFEEARSQFSEEELANLTVKSTRPRTCSTMMPRIRSTVPLRPGRALHRAIGDPQNEPLRVKGHQAFKLQLPFS